MGIAPFLPPSHNLASCTNFSLCIRSPRPPATLPRLLHCLPASRAQTEPRAAPAAGGHPPPPCTRPGQSSSPGPPSLSPSSLRTESNFCCPTMHLSPAAAAAGAEPEPAWPFKSSGGAAMGRAALSGARALPDRGAGEKAALHRLGTPIS